MTIRCLSLTFILTFGSDRLETASETCLVGLSRGVEGGDYVITIEKLGWKYDNNSKGQEEPSPVTGQTK
jgi:hypothetical protein